MNLTRHENMLDILYRKNLDSVLAAEEVDVNMLILDRKQLVVGGAAAGEVDFKILDIPYSIADIEQLQIDGKYLEFEFRGRYFDGVEDSILSGIYQIYHSAVTGLGFNSLAPENNNGLSFLDHNNHIHITVVVAEGAECDIYCEGVYYFMDESIYPISEEA